MTQQTLTLLLTASLIVSMNLCFVTAIVLVLKQSNKERQEQLRELGVKTGE